jgi:hypothetical protein
VNKPKKSKAPSGAAERTLAEFFCRLSGALDSPAFFPRRQPEGENQEVKELRQLLP